jgi:hypothetical protein
MSDELKADKLRVLLAWGTVLATVALITLGLDIMIKRQLLDMAKEADRKIRVLREAADGRPAGGAAAEAAHSDNGLGPVQLAAVDDVAGTQEARDDHEGRARHSALYVDGRAESGPERDGA